MSALVTQNSRRDLHRNISGREKADILGIRKTAEGVEVMKKIGWGKVEDWLGRGGTLR